MAAGRDTARRRVGRCVDRSGGGGVARCGGINLFAKLDDGRQSEALIW